MNYERREARWKKKRQPWQSDAIKRMKNKNNKIENKIRAKTMSNYIIDTLWENECIRNMYPLEWDSRDEHSTICVVGNDWIFTSIHRLNLWPWTKCVLCVIFYLSLIRLLPFSLFHLLGGWFIIALCLLTFHCSISTLLLLLCFLHFMFICSFVTANHWLHTSKRTCKLMHNNRANWFPFFLFLSNVAICVPSEWIARWNLSFGGK